MASGASDKPYRLEPRNLPVSLMQTTKPDAVGETDANEHLNSSIIRQKALRLREDSTITLDDRPNNGRASVSPSPVRLGGSPASCESPRSSQTRLSAADPLAVARALGKTAQRNGEVQDLICIGFGPASLAIAIALADIYSKSSRPLPKATFIEKQEEFSWHSGMQLPLAKMQISFLKDLATPRDPTSPFTFINYLHKNGRLNHFINLSTFLPTRVEFEAYMLWCAKHFESAVIYGRQVTGVEPDQINPITQRIQTFKVKWQEIGGAEQGTLSGRNVVVALGGEAFVPEIFRPFTSGPCPKVKHSNQYGTTAKWLENLLRKPSSLRRQREAKEEELSVIKNKRRESHHVENIRTKNDVFVLVEKKPAQSHSEVNHIAKLEQEISDLLTEEERCNSSLRELGLSPGRQRFVVVGSGQSAAEIFSDLWSRFPDADVSLVIKDTALRPSDDSPFVNEIFDPERVDDLYSRPPQERKHSIAQDRGTNYGVVRLQLLEHIYEQMYMQRLHEPDPSRWRCQIIPDRKVVGVETFQDKVSLRLRLTPAQSLSSDEVVEQLTCSFVFVATGYTRNAHEEVLRATRELLPVGHTGEGFPVARNYRIEYDREKVEDGSGVWLQGCNESTHGLSDTLLSILAVRGGEVVSSIFGDDLATVSAGG